MTGPYEVLTMGRIGVDIYPLQVGTRLEDVTSFGKYLGGSATNVAVTAARLGRRSAVITRTGDDPFGRFLHRALRDLDYRPTLWPSREEARRWTREALPHATVAVGNLDECETATGTREPEAAGRALRFAFQQVFGETESDIDSVAPVPGGVP